MSSRVIYPPILNSYSPAFVYGNDSVCRIQFSLSTLNSGGKDIGGVQAVVYRQATGENIVNKTSKNGRYRSSGVILNLEMHYQSDNLYYIDILNEDIGPNGSGWNPGDVYKVQIRLVEKGKHYQGKEGESTYLNKYADYFSEWSTVCVTKAIGQPVIDIPSFNFNSEKDKLNQNVEKLIYLSTTEIYGTYSCPDSKNEYLYSYTLELFDLDGVSVEKSDKIFTEKYSEQDRNSFKYKLKTELEDRKSYTLSISYETINHFTETYIFDIQMSAQVLNNNYFLRVIDLNKEYIDENGIREFDMEDFTSLEYEQEEGCIGLKIYIGYTEMTKQYGSSLVSTNLCIRRTDERTDYTEWEDLKIINLYNENPNNYSIIYDYTVESGVHYKYGIQEINRYEERSKLNSISDKISRTFEYSYLIGEGGRRLKLRFNNEIGSYKVNVSDTISQTLGRKYPFITRNAATYYRTFQLNGLVSFLMDRNFHFIDAESIGIQEDQVSKYMYDYTIERKFRDEVMSFLYNGKAKLFKSPTEGNIVIRLTDVSFTPDKTLNRLISSFASTATEICENSLDNYKKYGIWDGGEFVKDLSTTEIFLGQLIMNLPISFVTNKSGNLIDYIVYKYDTESFPMANKVKKLKYISNFKIQINGYYDYDGVFRRNPLKIYVQNNQDKGLCLGNNIQYNNTVLTLQTKFRNFYEFDESINFLPSDRIVLFGDIDRTVASIDITVDFLCHMQIDDYIEKEILSKEYAYNVSQVHGIYENGHDIYNDIFYKYYIEHEKDYRRLSDIVSFEIEAIPNTVFWINSAETTKVIDEVPTNVPVYTDINWTGVLNIVKAPQLEKLVYIGVRDPKTGEINTEIKSDVIVNYYYHTETGKYK